MSSFPRSLEGEARSPVGADLERALESHRRELTGYCYRMLGAGWQASEVAELLGTTVASVNSALQRARATLAAMPGEVLDPTVDPGQKALLARYVDAFERYDIPALVGLLCDDVVLSMPPWDVWLEGPQELADWFLGQGIVCEHGRLLPINVNGTAGFGNYHLVRPGLWEPWAIQVIEVAGGKIVGHHNFLYPELFAEFGLPERIEA